MKLNWSFKSILFLSFVVSPMAAHSVDYPFRGYFSGAVDRIKKPELFKKDSLNLEFTQNLCAITFFKC